MQMRLVCFDIYVFRHVLFAPSVFNTYAGTSFPGLVDLMWHIERLTGDEMEQRWDQVRRHLATIIYTIESATSTLKPTTQFN
jgi:N-acetylated-alpha-linked acidic dipeptidase